MKTLKSTSLQIILTAVIISLGLMCNSLMAQSVGTGSLPGANNGPGQEDYYTVFIPNCFTPNEDGLNDRFIVGSDLVKRISLRIYDKTGEEVFATIEMAQGWDGKHHGREMKQDSYLYRVEVDYMNGTNEVIVGQVSLMR